MNRFLLSAHQCNWLRGARYWCYIIDSPPLYMCAFIYRLSSWFECKFKFTSFVNKFLLSEHQCCPSYRYLVLHHQQTARLSPLQVHCAPRLCTPYLCQFMFTGHFFSLCEHGVGNPSPWASKEKCEYLCATLFTIYMSEPKELGSVFHACVTFCWYWTYSPSQRNEQHHLSAVIF